MKKRDEPETIATILFVMMLSVVTVPLFLELASKYLF